MNERMYSRGEKKLEKNRKDRKQTEFVKNEEPFVSGHPNKSLDVILWESVAY